MITEVRVDKIDPTTMKWADGREIKSVRPMGANSVWRTITILGVDGKTDERRHLLLDDMVSVEVPS